MKIINFKESPLKNKKYRVNFILKNKLYSVDFGNIYYQHYRDSTPLQLYRNLNHYDIERKRNYLKRSSGIKNKNGELTKDNPLSANYWSRKFLWS